MTNKTSLEYCTKVKILCLTKVMSVSWTSPWGWQNQEPTVVENQIQLHQNSVVLLSLSLYRSPSLPTKANGSDKLWSTWLRNTLPSFSCMSDAFFIPCQFVPLICHWRTKLWRTYTRITWNNYDYRHKLLSYCSKIEQIMCLFRCGCMVCVIEIVQAKTCWLFSLM